MVSSIKYWVSGSPVSESNTLSHTPALAQRVKRWWVVFHLPYRSGRSSHRAPDRKTHKTPFTNSRLSAPAAAPVTGLAGQKLGDLIPLRVGKLVPFGALVIDKGRVTDFLEKPRGDGGFINGGFFVLSPKVIDLIEGDETIWEQEPLRALAASGQLSAFEHLGFWRPMDTLRDRMYLEELWQTGRAPWKVW